jgi:hypothetical protein
MSMLKVNNTYELIVSLKDDRIEGDFEVKQMVQLNGKRMWYITCKKSDRKEIRGTMLLIDDDTLKRNAKIIREIPKNS